MRLPHSSYGAAALAGLLIFGATNATGQATAQHYPARPVRLIVAFPPGTPPDIIGRVAAQQLGVSLGQQVIVENRPGAGGTIGTGAAARALPDGYTLALATTGSRAAGPALYPQAGYDAEKSFVRSG